jgi:hypothetical protein
MYAVGSGSLGVTVISAESANVPLLGVITGGGHGVMNLNACSPKQCSTPPVTAQLVRYFLMASSQGTPGFDAIQSSEQKR